MLLADLEQTSREVAATAARNAKIGLLAACLRRMAPDEAPIGVAFLSGQLRQRQIGVGYASLRELPTAANQPVLTLHAVDAAFEAIGQLQGADSQATRRRRLAELFGQATQPEQHFLVRLLTGELRQGALEGIMLEALARAIDAPGAAVRRAVMLRGDLGAVAEVGLRDGPPGLHTFHLHVGQAIQPMLAQSAPSLTAALERAAPAGIEWKLDGNRIQVHVQGADVRIFTRSLDDITARVPELVEMAHQLPVRAAVLDGEAIALREDGRPHPFQVSASRLGSRLGIDQLRSSLPLSPFLFDVLHLDGADLLDLSYAERRAHLAAVVPPAWRVPRIVVEATPPAADIIASIRSAAEAFMAEALARGHEGVLVKALDSTYEAGRRGAGWIKVKPRHTFDLAILAAEWGHGRRRGWLSNLHLGARDPRSGSWVMLGKTFKGLTDAMLAWQTERLLELERERDAWTVYVRPELLVEVAFDGVQRSPRYPGGLALRFARVLRYRPDKRPEDADTIDAIRQLSAHLP